MADCFSVVRVKRSRSSASIQCKFSYVLAVPNLPSQRRHLVGLVHFILTACRGSQLLKQQDTLNVLLHIVEFSATPMMPSSSSHGVQRHLVKALIGVSESSRAYRSRRPLWLSDRISRQFCHATHSRTSDRSSRLRSSVSRSRLSRFSLLPTYMPAPRAAADGRDRVSPEVAAS